MSGATPTAERAEALRRLRAREVNCLFAVDLFNEGLDLPQVDTVLFLRPTQSATVFLQQLGRGLRRAAGKAVLTVLDFIGQHRREFRFDVRYRALTGGSRRALMDDLEHGFPFLPVGVAARARPRRPDDRPGERAAAVQARCPRPGRRRPVARRPAARRLPA